MPEIKPLRIDEDVVTWDRIRSACLAELGSNDGERWTDHNLSDPGVTILEAAAFAVADLHYRTDVRDLDTLSMETRSWVDHEDHHWSGLALPLGAGDRRVLADALAEDLDAYTAAVLSSDSRRAAIAEVMDGPAGAGPLTRVQATAVVRLVRQPVLTAARFQHSDLIDQCIDDADPGAGASTVAATLRGRAGLDEVWTDELESLVRHARHDQIVTAARLGIDRIVSMTGGIVDGLDPAGRPEIDAPPAGFDADMRAQFVALSPVAGGAQPEDYEGPDGATTVWPPHPLQARTTEPVTETDYAGLARSVDGVARAWLVPGRLPGIDWQGASQPAADDEPGACTILVERDPDADLDLSDTNFLRHVLYGALGPADRKKSPSHTTRFGLDSMWEHFDHDVDHQAPRRVICDEVGVSEVRRQKIVLSGVVHVPVSANHDVVIDDLYSALTAFLNEGRPEVVDPVVIPETPSDASDIDGPWPCDPGQPHGWTPGQPVKVAELIQRIVAVPDVIGAVDVRVQVEGSETWERDEAPIDAGCVPTLGDRRCLRLQVELDRGDG